VGCACIGGGEGWDRWSGGSWVGSDGPFVSRKLQYFVDGTAFIVGRVCPQAQCQFGGCVSGFTAFLGHMVSAAFDAFVRT